MADNKILGIDKGILLSFVLLLAMVGIIGALYLQQYIFGIVLGTVFNLVQDDNNTYAQLNATFIANNVSNESLAHTNIIVGSIRIDNGTDQLSLNNFTIDYDAGTIGLLSPPNSTRYNGTTMFTNYSFFVESPSDVNVTSGTKTFLSTTESSFFTTAGRVNTGATFAGSLIVVAVVLVVFGGFLLYGRGYVKKWKGGGGKKGSGLDY